MNGIKDRLFKSQRECYIPALKFYNKRVSKSTYLPLISRAINKYFYNIGIGATLNRYDNSFTLYSSKFDKKLYRDYQKNEIFCNFGSGAFFHNKWKNYDYPGQSKYYKSIQGTEGSDFSAIDLCSSELNIPEKDNTVSLIYCSHTLEHLEETSAAKFLNECYRILKPKGIIRLVLPNTSNNFFFVSQLKSQENIKYETISAYMRNAASTLLSDAKNFSDQEIQKLFDESACDAKRFYELAKSKDISTKFDSNDPGRHITFFDYVKLILLSKCIGFSECVPLYQGSSLAEPFTNLNVFDTSEPQIAFYAEMIK